MGRICYNHFQQMLIECTQRTPRNRKFPLCWKLDSHLGTLDTLRVHRWNWICLPKAKARSSTFADVCAELPHGVGFRVVACVRKRKDLHFVVYTYIYIYNVISVCLEVFSNDYSAS